MNKEEYEVKSEEVLNIIEKYREKINISRFYLSFREQWNKRYQLEVIFKCDYKRYDMEDIRECHLEIDFTNEKNIIKLGNWVSGSGIVFDNIDKLKSLIEMAEELQKIDYLKLNEFKKYVDMKDQQKELEEKKKEIENQLLKQKEEIEKRLDELTINNRGGINEYRKDI